MNLSRRQFLRLGPAGILRASSRRDKAPAPVVRPPGALKHEAEFLANCKADQGCTACIEACTFDVILAQGPEHGKAERAPYLELLDNPCRWCQPMVCIEACDTGALSQVPGEQVAAIAKVQLDLTDCLNSQGTLCTDCSDFCPPVLHAMVSRGRKPVLNLDNCVGCGLCIWHCDAAGSPITLTAVEAPAQSG